MKLRRGVGPSRVAARRRAGCCSPAAASSPRAPPRSSTAPGSPTTRSTTSPRRSAPPPTQAEAVGPVPARWPSRGVKQQSLALLIDTELSQQYAEDEGITPRQALVNGFYAQLEPGITPLPSTARTVLTDVFERLGRGPRDPGRRPAAKATGQTGRAPSNLEQLHQRRPQGARRRGLKKADDRHRPALRPGRKDGFPGGGDGSVSEAASTSPRTPRPTRPTRRASRRCPPARSAAEPATADDRPVVPASSSSR